MDFMLEVVVWEKISADIVVRYTGFQNINTGAIWFACANYINPNSDEIVPNGDMAGIEALASIFLEDLPAVENEWKIGLQEALEYFRNNNPKE